MSEDRRARADDDGPEIEPGQIWLIEQIAACGLSALDRRALAGAQIVLYEHSLFPLLAPLLLAGRYCEPLPPAAAEGSPAISPRALKLAGEGWSVAQLIEPSRLRRERLRKAARDLATLRMRLIAKPATGCCRGRDAGLAELDELADGTAENDLLTLILSPVAAVRPPTPYAFTGNGLAG